MKEYLELFRLGNGIMGIIGIFAASFIAAGTGVTDHLFNIAVSFVIVILFIAGGNSINDYVDRDIDVISHPNRPIPMGTIKPERALQAGAAALIASCAMSILLWDVLSTAIVVIACIMMASYELFLKQRGLIGNITIATLTGMVFLVGGAVVDNVSGCYAVALMAAVVSVGREIVKDIEDMEGDEGRSTLPMKIGVRNAGIVAAAMYIIGPILSVWPFIDHSFGTLYCVVFVADAMFIYAAGILFNNPHRSEKIAKYAMFVALIAFILGVI